MMMRIRPAVGVQEDEVVVAVTMFLVAVVEDASSVHSATPIKETMTIEIVVAVILAQVVGSSSSSSSSSSRNTNPHRICSNCSGR